ncbi:MAG: SLATT domain-containing protein [Cellulomonas sp.]|nr:SLATT domain-containing protein [Cellulomonas sp.]MCR6646645.1 SLATT domain-containing protein [Cellulomonas sp.]
MAAREQLALECKRAYKTYCARQSACNRLGKRARAWNWALVSLATSTAVASIGMLTDRTMYGENGDTLMVCLAVLALVASLATTNMDYSGRSRNMFLNYRKIQRISVEMERLLHQSRAPVTADAVANLSDEYQSLLDEAENHTTGDHLRHFSRTHVTTHPHYSVDPALYSKRRRSMAIDAAITLLPYATLAVPVVLIAPLVAKIVP